MNLIKLNGRIRNIRPSHEINGIQYEKADLIVPRNHGDDDVISLRFKKYSNKYSDGDQVELTGNIRSYSTRLSEDKNKVDIYVFTYFDLPTDNRVVTNEFELSGKICKIQPTHITRTGKKCLHLILANNIISEDKHQKINSYIPLTFWGKYAEEAEGLKVGDAISVAGELHSRTFKKRKENEEVEIITAHEGVVTSLCIEGD